MSQPLILRSSPFRLVLAVLTPVILLSLAAASAGDRVSLGVVIVSLLGLGTGAVVTLDVPLRCEFTEDGVTRVCMLRKQQFSWSDVVAIERTNSRPRRRGTPPEERAARGGQGLAVRTGPRRVYLLVDRRESHAEWTELRDLLKPRATVLRASAPPLDAAPAGPRR